MKAPVALIAATLTLGACSDWQSTPAASGTGTGAGTAPSGQSSAVDSQVYLNQATAADMFEIESSRLALERSRDPAVRGLATQMLDEHTRSSSKMQAASNALGMKSQVNTVGGVAAQRLAQLRNLSGADFDRTYLSMQAEAHEQAYNIHSGYATHGETPQLRSLAAEMATLIQQHRSHVHQASATMR